MRRISFLKYLLLLTAITVSAQVQFNVIPPQGAVVGRQFRVTYRVTNGQGTALKAPQVEGCTLMYGPSTSTSQSTSIYNGQVTSTYTTDYIYAYTASEEGTYTIPAASISVDGKTLRTEAKTFKVGAAPSQPSNQGGNSQRGGYDRGYSEPSSSTPVSKDDIFMRLIVNRSSVYENEPVECVLRLYTRYENLSNFAQQKPAAYDGCLIEEVNIEPRLGNVETVNGQQYATADLQKFILFPQKSGSMTISSASYKVTVTRMQVVYNGYFPRTYPEQSELSLPAAKATFSVKPLPQPAPVGFNGMVGSFTLKDNLSITSLKTNEAATYKLTIDGTGNIKYINEPEIAFPDEFEMYTPSKEINAHVSGATVTGKAQFEYTFVPKSVGRFSIPPVEIVYFNPSKGEYETLTAKGYEVNVAKGAGGTGNVERNDVAVKNRDILHIRLGDKPQHLGRVLLIDRWWYWLLYVFIAAIFACGVVMASKRIKANADVVGRRAARANKVARKRLSAAERQLKLGHTEQFYDTLLKTLWGFLSDKLSMPSSELTRDNVTQQLIQFGASDETCKSLIDLLDTCEMARYTPQASGDASRTFEEAVNVMRQLLNIKK